MSRHLSLDDKRFHEIRAIVAKEMQAIAEKLKVAKKLKECPGYYKWKDTWLNAAHRHLCALRIQLHWRSCSFLRNRRIIRRNFDRLKCECPDRLYSDHSDQIHSDQILTTGKYRSRAIHYESNQQFHDVASNHTVTVFTDRFYDTRTMVLSNLNCWLVRRDYADGTILWKLHAFVFQVQRIIYYISYSGTEEYIAAVLVAVLSTLPNPPNVTLDASIPLGKLYPHRFMILPTARVTDGSFTHDAVAWMQWGKDDKLINNAHVVKFSDGSNGKLVNLPIEFSKLRVALGATAPYVYTDVFKKKPKLVDYSADFELVDKFIGARQQFMDRHNTNLQNLMDSE